jgi:hypothetical protein
MSAVSDSVTTITQFGDAWQVTAPAIASALVLEEQAWPSGSPAGVQIVEGGPGVFDIYGLSATSLASMDADLNAKFAMAGFTEQLGLGGHAGADAQDHSASGGHSSAPAPPPEVANLLAASKEEMTYEGHIQGFAAYATQQDWDDYTFGTRTINSYIDLANDGFPPDASEWHRALNDVGQARNQLCSNAEYELNQRISARAAHLEADKRDVAAALAAVKDVEEAQQAAEEAEHRAKWLEAMKMLSEVVEVIGNPHEFLEAEVGFALQHLTHLALAASTLKADFGSFIQAEAQYMVQVTLASHGFASAEEMERRVATASDNIEATAQALHDEVSGRDEARKYHAQPIHH